MTTDYGVFGVVGAFVPIMRFSSRTRRRPSPVLPQGGLPENLRFQSCRFCRRQKLPAQLRRIWSGNPAVQGDQPDRSGPGRDRRRRQPRPRLCPVRDHLRRAGDLLKIFDVEQVVFAGGENCPPNSEGLGRATRAGLFGINWARCRVGQSSIANVGIFALWAKTAIPPGLSPYHPMLFIPGASRVPALQQSESENARTYAQSQKQRRLERDFRKPRCRASHL